MKGVDPKDDKNPKYLLGAVPEVDGVVTFQKNFSVTDKNEQQIYDVMLTYIKNSLIGNAIQFPKSEYTRIISEEKENGTIVARVDEYMTFYKAFFSLDRTRFRYMLSASYPRSGKFRRLTVDRTQEIFEGFMDALSTMEVEEQVITKKRKGIVEE